MNLHAALVRFIQHKLQRIVARIFADFAGQHIGPRQNIRPPERRTVRFHTEKDGVDPQALQVIEFSDQRQLLLRDAALRRAGDNRPDRRPVKARNGGEPHAAHRLRCACPALTAAAFGGVTRDLGALLVQLNSMPAAMSAAPASATLLAKGNRREWLMMNSRVLRSSRVGAILLLFAGQSNSFIRFIRRFAIA